ncbi:MAG: tRNA (adenosine(37)-N6)-threonylcarbamoyltransferase complex dimerization subunit type 1 TsaB [Pyrinomonadaceae bacterium]|nr:tRNA (adenosine(37)-N6)-threonylcarbamoyltransferase complex dimerization subunit type 1 TsaB [Pyrinomonadaceae bacterium]
MSETILAFDTVVSSGDVSVWRDGRELDSSTGESGASSSETLLNTISRIIEENQLERSEIDLLAVSLGPGSYTGIRIGIATAYGLSASLNCETIGLSTLEILANSIETNEWVVSGVWAGRNEIAHQEFEAGKDVIGGIELETVEDLLSKYSGRNVKIALDRKSFEEVRKVRPKPLDNIFTPKTNIASVLAEIAAGRLVGATGVELTPIYSRSLFDKK